jgi:hypothetical protein
MKYNCDLISDLLPLYKDDICSEATKKIVEEHLAECTECRKMLADMSDVTIDEKIVKEKDEVINSQAKFFKRKSAFAGSIIALIFSIPILVCLIVNLATGAGLTWFFIVLAGILVAASLIIVPLMVPENKMFTTMASFTGSVLLCVCILINKAFEHSRRDFANLFFVKTNFIESLLFKVHRVSLATNHIQVFFIRDSLRHTTLFAEILDCLDLFLSFALC